MKRGADKTFDFRGVRAWTWHSSGAGDVKMALTPDDNPAAVRDRFAPVIEDALTKELTARRWTHTAAYPQIYVNYYVFISRDISSRTDWPV